MSPVTSQPLNMGHPANGSTIQYCFVMAHLGQRSAVAWPIGLVLVLYTIVTMPKVPSLPASKKTQKRSKKIKQVLCHYRKNMKKKYVYIETKTKDMYGIQKLMLLMFFFEIINFMEEKAQVSQKII